MSAKYPCTAAGSIRCQQSFLRLNPPPCLSVDLLQVNFSTWPIHDLIRVKRKTTTCNSGESRIPDDQYMHGSLSNPRDVQRGTSSGAPRLPPAPAVGMWGNSTLSECAPALPACPYVLAGLDEILWADSTPRSLQRRGALVFRKARSLPALSSALSLQAENSFPRGLVGLQAYVPSFPLQEFPGYSILD